MPRLTYIGSAPLSSTPDVSYRIQTTDKASGKSQVVVDVPKNQFGKEQHYTITFSVPPVRKENDKEGEPEIQELLHVSKIERTSRKRKTSKQGPTGNCVICWENSCDFAFCPCGHVTTCYKCGMTLYLKNKSCPMCRQIITNVMKIYFSCQK